MIPQYVPRIDRESLAKEVSDYILSDGYFTEYKKTEELEAKIAEYLQVKHCIMVNNGTISLSLALLASGVKAGDWVLVPNITMMATEAAVLLIGAKPVFIDVDQNNLCMNLAKAEEFLSGAKAVLYVTLNGRKAPAGEYEYFRRTCQEKGVALIEDNAQSFGSCDSQGFRISCPKNGIGSFSFSMPKIITTGQGGCLVTDSDDLAKRIRELKDFGRARGGIDIHDSFGINCKLTEIQAIMGLNQLTSIDARVFGKKLIYNTYEKLLKDVPQVVFLKTNLDATTPWFVDIYLEQRDKLQAFLKENEIGSRAIYPELTSQLVNKEIRIVKHMRVSQDVAEQGLWLPSSFDLKHKDIELVCNKIKEFYNA